MELETELFGECSIEEIKQGYKEQDGEYICLLCGERFNTGEIYTFDGKFYEASKAVKLHIQEKHQSVKHFLLNVQASNMGLSDLQLQLLNFFAKGLTDKEIADYLGVSGSTIRNHRFKLREREKQNRLFLALMASLEDKTKENSNYFASKKELRQNENIIGNKERKKIIDYYMTQEGELKSYPSYEKSKQIILEKIAEGFQTGRKYSEEEINYQLANVYKDYRLIKEELMNYNYLGRSNKGGIYWLRTYR